MKTRFSFVCSGLLSLLFASPQAQLSTDLIMGTYNSNVSATTNGAINKLLMESTIERNNAGRSAGRSSAAARLRHGYERV